MNKKVLQLTHPVSGNYGGLLQCYALQQALFSIGIDVTCYRYSVGVRNSRLGRIRQSLASLVKWLILYLGVKHFFTNVPASIARTIGEKFSRKHILSNSRPIGDNLAYVVGSDQVWRLLYSRAIKSPDFFFLSFASSEQRRKSIAYAASYGTDEWEGSPEETEICRRCLREFKAVSVREHSGVQICRDVFNVTAVQMPDPTLLLPSCLYDSIIENESTVPPANRSLAVYILDDTSEQKTCLRAVSEEMGLILLQLMPNITSRKRRLRFPMSVPQWLRYIRECDYLVTDSFHGCVFSIIFNKPFVCLGNEARGRARFDTLFGTFGLRSRLLIQPTPEDICRVLKTPIDWELVNRIHESERKRGIDFLTKNLAT